MTRDAQKQSVRSINGANQSCASCGVKPGAEHSGTCQGGNHLLQSKCYHEWTRSTNPEYADRYLHQHEVKRIVCGKCNKHPKPSELESIDAVLDLRSILKPGDKIYTTLRHVSRSGMQRVIDVHVISDNEPRWIGYLVAKALEYRFDDRKQGIVVGGCGVDMGFHLVNNLGYRLYGQIVKESKTPEAVEIRKQLLKSDRFYFTQGGREAPDPEVPSQEWFGGAGYAFKHAWL